MDLLAQCSVFLQERNSVLLTLFIAGLISGFTHCLVMCGPIVICHRINAKATACSSACHSKNMTNGLAYHAGRMLSYGAQGGVAALLARQLMNTSIWSWLSTALLITAGVMMLTTSLTSCVSAEKKNTHRFAQWTAGKNEFLQGIFLGFLPCGMIYAALMIAATLANPLQGMLAMMCFALGTMPALWMVGEGAAHFSIRWQVPMHRWGKIMMAGNGIILLAIAGKHWI